MGDDVSCPECGRLMLPTTGGYFCPACKHRADPSTISGGGPKTPSMGVKLPPSEEDTLLDPSYHTDGKPTPSPGGRPPVGASIFDSGARRLSAADEGPVFREDEPDGGPQISFAEDGNEKPFGETVVIAGDQKGDGASGDGEDVSPVVPENKEALFLPRCRTCDKVLELEEIADGECAACREGGAPSGRTRKDRRSPVAPPAGAATVCGGTLAALATTWAGVLVVVHTVQSDPGSWDGPQVLLGSWRIALVLFVLAASILWACGRRWAAGSVAALGTLAAVLAAVMLLSGSLVGNVYAASAWLAAGAAGALAGAVALVPRREFTPSRSRRRGRAGARRRPRNTAEAMAAPSGRSRRSRYRVSRLRAVLGGLVALGAAGVAGWQGALAYLAAPGAVRTFGPNALRAYGFGAVALAMGSLALWLIVSPPRGKTRLVALGAAVVAAPLPAWLLVGPILARRAGLGDVDSGGWLALPAGIGRVLGVGVLAELAPATVAAELKVGAAAALGAGLVASLFVLFSRSDSRGSGLAGLGLACVLVWGAGFSVALVRPGAGQPAEVAPSFSRPTAGPDASGPAASSPEVAAPLDPSEGGDDAAGALPEDGPVAGAGPGESPASPAPPAGEESEF